MHLVGIKPSRGSQSLFLLQEADTTHEWSDGEVSAFLSCKPKGPLSSTPPPTLVVPSLISLGPLESVADDIAKRLERSEIAALVEAFESTKQLPRDIDGRLLAGSRSLIGHDLGPEEKKQVRKAFVDVCRRRLAD